MLVLLSFYTSISTKHNASGKHEPAGKTADPYEYAEKDNKPVGDGALDIPQNNTKNTGRQVADPYHTSYLILHFAFWILHLFSLFSWQSENMGI